MSAADMTRGTFTVPPKKVSVNLTHEQLLQIVARHIMGNRDTFGIPPWIGNNVDVDVTYHTIAGQKMASVTYDISNAEKP